MAVKVTFDKGLMFKFFQAVSCHRFKDLWMQGFSSMDTRLSRDDCRLMSSWPALLYPCPDTILIIEEVCFIIPSWPMTFVFSKPHNLKSSWLDASQAVHYIEDCGLHYVDLTIIVQVGPTASIHHFVQHLMGPITSMTRCSKQVIELGNPHKGMTVNLCHMRYCVWSP